MLTTVIDSLTFWSTNFLNFNNITKCNVEQLIITSIISKLIMQHECTLSESFIIFVDIFNGYYNNHTMFINNVLEFII